MITNINLTTSKNWNKIFLEKNNSNGQMMTVSKIEKIKIIEMRVITAFVK